MSATAPLCHGPNWKAERAMSSKGPFPGMEFTLRLPDGRVAARVVLAPCSWCQATLQIPDQVAGHTATCPKAPASIRRISAATHAVFQAVKTGQSVREPLVEVGYAMADDLCDASPPSSLTPAQVTAWVMDLWAFAPAPAKQVVVEAALLRLEQRQEQPS